MGLELRRTMEVNNIDTLNTIIYCRNYVAVCNKASRIIENFQKIFRNLHLSFYVSRITSLIHG